MTDRLIVAILLAMAVAVAWARLLLWWRVARPAPGRTMLLVAVQPVLAGLLWLTLFPPPADQPGPRVLTVATRGAALASADVALPEAPRGSAAVRAPDLATALRRQPGAGALRIVGEGLESRDRDVARGLALAFDPPAPRRGLIALAPPATVAPGAAFVVGGQVADVTGGSVELLDPAGQRIARAALAASGAFALEGSARVAGVAVFRIRVRDAAGAVLDTADVPLVVAAARPPRILYLAGAPGAEVKYWRRWAADAGLDATVGMTAGGGIELGDPTPALNAATLARLDVLVIDERRWSELAAGQRAAVASALRGGMGLLFRVTEPPTADVQRSWARLGAPVTASRGERAVRLGGVDGPVLARWDALSGDAVPLARDAAGVPFAAWRTVGRGRVGVWTLGDAFALVTAGQGDRFAALWSGAVSILSRPMTGQEPTISPWPVVGERTILCNFASNPPPTTPSGARTTPLPNRSTRCAAYWPRESGWHSIAGKPFHVAAGTSNEGLRGEQRRRGTLALVGAGERRSSSPAAAAPGRSWRWLLAFLATAGLSWWFERRRRTG